MSLVGTRPILPDELEQYELHHRARISKYWHLLAHIICQTFRACIGFVIRYLIMSKRIMIYG